MEACCSEGFAKAGPFYGASIPTHRKPQRNWLPLHPVASEFAVAWLREFHEMIQCIMLEIHSSTTALPHPSPLAVKYFSLDSIDNLHFK